MKRLTIEEAKAEADKRGGKCLSTTFSNSHSLLTWECSKGHKWKASLANVRNKGSWCPECFQKRITIEDARALAREKNGFCLSPEYFPDRKLLWECSRGHQWQAFIGNVKIRGSWCPICSHMSRIGKSSWSKGKNKYNCPTIYRWSLQQKGRTTWSKGKTKYDDVRLEKSGLKRRGRTKEAGDINAIKSSERMKIKNPMFDPAIRVKAHINLNRAPSRPEKVIIEKNYPNLEYTGNGKFWVSLDNSRNKNPDFVLRPFHIHHKVIEVWGEYWHRNENPEDLVAAYRKCGITCLIIPDSSIKRNMHDQVIKDFICC